MKRFIFTILLMGLAVAFMEPAGNLFSTLLRLDEPRSYDIERGDWLSKIAQKHYGDASYWRELALVNRAPDADLIFPEEDIIVPSFDVVREIRQARSLSDVNSLVETQQAILAGRLDHETEPFADHGMTQDSDRAAADDSAPAATESADQAPAQPQSKPDLPGESETQTSEDEVFGLEQWETTEPLSAENEPFWSSTPMLTGIVVLAVVVAIGLFMFWRSKKREQEEVSYYGSGPEEDESDKDKEKSGFMSFDDSEKETTARSGSRRKKDVEVVQ